jgi:putative hydrolase of the HAD superfamily
MTQKSQGEALITHLLLDLDNTLYTARYGLEDKVSERINDFLVEALKISRDEVEKLRKELYVNYGTTVEWLIAEKGFANIEPYFKAICPENEAESLPPDPELGDFLASIPLPKAILTNSPREHAERILGKLGIARHFPHIFDIRFNDFKGKPRPEAYLRALEAMNAKPETTLFIDDCPNFVEGFLAIGGKALLLDEFDKHSDLQLKRIKNIREITGLMDSL